MLETLEIGIEHTTVQTVTTEMGTAHAGDPVLSTPSMILMIEGCCAQSVAPHLDDGETTVGVHVDVSHLAPSFPGEDVTVSSRLVDVDRRFLRFEVAASVGDRVLGTGTHRRAVVNPDRRRGDAPAKPALPALTDDLEQARRDLDRWGYCLLAGALSPEQVARTKHRLMEQAAAEAREGVATFDTGAHPSKAEGHCVNQRMSSLINKGAEFQEIALHPRVGALLEHLLGPRFLLTSFSANITSPGCELQELHQDQTYVGYPQPRYPIVSNVVWFLDDVTVANGGTHVVPGSHLWEHPLGDRHVQTAILEGPAGTAAIVEGRTWHGAGANRSDHRRHVLLSNYCRVWVRQQENMFLSLAPETEANLSEDLRRLLGFKTWATLGGVHHPNGVDESGYAHRPPRYVTELA
ncbi:MAG: phytanoyl-CoA dioxygenase family protein [Ilumatobacteraceae bacterium]